MSRIVEQNEQTRDGLKQTKLGPIPEDWEINQLRDLDCRFISGGTPSRQNSEYFGGEIPWLRTSEVQNRPVRSNEEFLTKEGLENSSAKIAPDGAVLVAMYGGGTVGNVGFLEFDAATNQACCAVLTDETRLSNQFLYQQLLFEHRRLVSYAAGSSQQNLSKSDVEQFDVRVPPLAEQRRIADILSTVDEQIQQTDEIIEETKKLKKGLMQDLLHRGIGHNEFKEMYIGPKRSTLPLDWDVVQLGEIADIQSGSTPKRSNEDYWDDGTIPWLKSGEFNDRVVSETEEYITEKALEESGCVVFPKGTLLIALYGKGTVSKTARLGLDAATNQAIAGLLPESGKFNPRYLQYYLIDSRDTLLNVTVNPSSDTGRTNIYMSALRQFKVALPPLEEQDAIVDQISTVDDKIADEQEYKQHLQELKHGLMQDLLTGKVRVNTDN